MKGQFPVLPPTIGRDLVGMQGECGDISARQGETGTKAILFRDHQSGAQWLLLKGPQQGC